MLLRNVSRGRSEARRRDRGEVDDGVEAREGLGGLPVVGEVGEQALAVRRAIVLRVHVEHVMALLAQVAHDPSASLAASTRDDDPHAASLTLARS